MSKFKREELHRIGDTEFYLDERFSSLKEIGRGSYGVVVSALDSKIDCHVAIKKISPMAKHTIDAKHVLREIRLMRHMGKHENVISLKDLVVREHADELYIIMELLDSDLHRVLQSKQPLTESHFRIFMHQLLCGVKYLHDNRIIHRDLKPGNLLVTRDCKLRITDFGLARERPEGKGVDLDTDIDVPMTEHVVTRWYRPPELMLCPDGLYDYAVDMWSCGCILAEMLGRRPLFPGKNFIHQLTLIFDVIGSPPMQDVAHIRNLQALKFLESQRSKVKTPFQLIYPKASSGAVAMLECMLLFAPSSRMTADEALKSPYLVAIQDTPSLIFPPVSEMFEFCFERTNLSKYQLKQMIVNESRSLRHDNSTNMKKFNSSDSNKALADKMVGESEEKERHERIQEISQTRSDSTVTEEASYAQQEHTCSDSRRKQEKSIKERLNKDFTEVKPEVAEEQEQQQKASKESDDCTNADIIQDENRLNEMVERFKAIKMKKNTAKEEAIVDRSRTVSSRRENTVATTAIRRRNSTIPISPKFSRMNYQSKKVESQITGTRSELQTVQDLKVRSKPLTMRTQSAQKTRRALHDTTSKLNHDNNHGDLVVMSRRNVRSAGTARRPVFY